MSLRGTLDTMAAEDVLDWAGRRRLSGPVTFERAGLTRSVTVEDGQIVWASSNRRDEQLGVILVRSGLVGERALADALEARGPAGRANTIPLGKVLLMSGLITEAALVEILATKIRETVTDVLTWTDGAFEVGPRVGSPQAGVSSTLGIDVCLTVARRRAARMAELMERLGGDDATFAVPLDATPPRAEAHAGTDHAVDPARAWAMAGDRHSAGEIAAAFAGARFETYTALVAMVQSGALALDPTGRGGRSGSAVELAAGARGRLRQGDRAGAFAMAAHALHQDPNDDDVRKTFAQAQRARVAELAKQWLGRHRVPKRIREITGDLAQEHQLSAAEVELAGRIDGRWDLLSLVKSASVREAEALLAFAHLAEAGIVELG